MADKRLAETLLEIDGIETCYGQSQVLFGRGGIMGMLGRASRG